jgi:hypothetical protein
MKEMDIFMAHFVAMAFVRGIHFLLYNSRCQDNRKCWSLSNLEASQK